MLLEISSIALGAALAAWFAVQVYFRQREHELILNRYLEGSLDHLAADLSHVSESFQHNWARCLAILKSYRDSPEDFDLSELTAGFVDVPGSRLNIVAHHRLQTLTGSSNYWHLHQKAMAFFTTANSIIVKEIPEVIRVKQTTDRISHDPKQIVEEAFDLAKQKDEESHKYIELVSEYQVLSAALEGERYRFSTLTKFREKDEVQNSLNRVNERVKWFRNNEGAQQSAAADAAKLRG